VRRDGLGQCECGHANLLCTIEWSGLGDSGFRKICGEPRTDPVTQCVRELRPAYEGVVNVSPIAARTGEGPLTELRAGAQRWPRERALMPPFQSLPAPDGRSLIGREAEVRPAIR